jgi:hypothetical protein
MSDEHVMMVRAPQACASVETQLGLARDTHRCRSSHFFSQQFSFDFEHLSFSFSHAAANSLQTDADASALHQSSAAETPAADFDLDAYLGRSRGAYIINFYFSGG